MSDHEQINYLEFAAVDLAKTKSFFESVFNWQFTDYGDDYTSFQSAVMSGGFYRGEGHSSYEQGGCLVVFYSKNLENTLAKIVEGGGRIIKPTFEFPGGRRFHFSEPSGNEFAVWSDR